MAEEIIILKAQTTPRDAPHDDQLAWAYDLSGLDLAQASDLMLDAAMRVAKLTGIRPTHILRSAVETAPQGF